MPDFWTSLAILFLVLGYLLVLYYSIIELKRLGQTGTEQDVFKWAKEPRPRDRLLISLCPESLAKSWRIRTIVLRQIPHLVFVTTAVIYLFFSEPDFLRLKLTPDLEPIHLISGALILLFSVNVLRRFVTHWGLQRNLFLVLDGEGIYQSSFSRKKRSSQFVWIAFCLLGGYFIINDFNQWKSGESNNLFVHSPFFLVVMCMVIVTESTSDQTILSNTGYFIDGFKTNWSSVEEYRWLNVRDEDEVVFILRRQNLSSPIKVMGIPANKTEEAAAFLEQKLPGKRRGDVETALEQLEPVDDSLSINQAPA